MPVNHDLLQAVINGNLADLQAALEKGAKVNAKD